MCTCSVERYRPVSNSVFKHKCAGQPCRPRRTLSKVRPGDLTKAYLVFLENALGSASEVRYLLGLSVRLGFFRLDDVTLLERGYTDAIKSLQSLIDKIG